MKHKIGLVCAAIALSSSLVGCVVVPARHYGRPVIIAPDRHHHYDRGDRYDRYDRYDRHDRRDRYDRRGRW
ncbi:hypothetical protein [Crenobacter cavernae]|uniref:Lipoprotein n=1 Tax=Crenobacter cavernae TaxID=2290923 RepID=A0ABY0FDX1_9NEIS|nr:hypothetical protein [Crenobacter cavernae]RXZ44198.1 hypothetical protein EBB06_06580 [Crenobacter cavernae]